MIETPITAASTFAGDIDHLILEITVIVGAWFVLAEALLFFFIFKFKAKKGKRAEYITGLEPRMRRWLIIPPVLVLICDVFLIFGAFRVWTDIKIDLPEAEATVRVIGQQWAWTFEHPGPDGELDTDDDIITVDELHVEVNKLYHFKLQSRDVLHSFSVPVFRLKQDAIPGREITGWFEPTTTGTFDIQCAEICGIGHGVMAGRIIIGSPEQHAAWVKENSPNLEVAVSSQ